MNWFRNSRFVGAVTPQAKLQFSVRRLLVAVAFLVISASGPAFSAETSTIVLIGGMPTDLPHGQHDYPDGVLKLERLINSSPDFGQSGANVKVFPVGFPQDLAEIADASVVVLYFGVQRAAASRTNPIQDAAVQRAVGELMARGVGIVALHQAFTMPEATDGAPFVDWLGGVRMGMADSTVETAPVVVATQEHPIANGVGAFNLLDEFYPTIAFSEGAEITPILSARIHVQHRGSAAVFEEPAENRVIAWAHERADGGRAFAFSGGHYVASFDHPQVQNVVLNAILWAAGGDVPEAGVTTGHPEPHRVILPAGEVEVLPQSWGELRWFASRALGNSTTMTVGLATVRPGESNPPHWHPNCDEILHVVQGHIMHRVGDEMYEMRAGDTVVIPQGTVHNAHNIGTEDALLMVSFNSADRVAVGYE